MAELRQWERSAFRVYDEGDCALVDRMLIDVNRAAYGGGGGTSGGGTAGGGTAGDGVAGGGDRAVAAALARRARAELSGFAALDEADVVADLQVLLPPPHPALLMRACSPRSQ